MDASDPLLQTKVAPHRLRDRHVMRPRLVEKLQAARKPDCRLALIAAPAGYGKSSLVSEWVRQAECPYVWLSLDEEDSNPRLFWRALAAAVADALPFPISRLQQYVDHARSCDGIAAARLLLEEIGAAGSTLLLILDDYHRIDGGEHHAALRFLIQHGGESLRLVLVSRTDPALPLARLRAAGELLEVRAADLAFSRAEAAALLASGLDARLTPSDVDRLWSRTEGWAAGLQLAALWLERSENPSEAIAAFSGSQRYVLDYLSEEILAQQPPRRLRFLLETSLLEPLCASLCVAVTEDPESPEHLTSLQQQNAFISSLDDGDRWLRYHPLFADYLRTQLAYRHPERVPALHRRAALWYAEAGLFPQAAQHVTAAADPMFTANFARRFWETAVQHGQVKHALGWYEALPPEMIEADRPLVTGYCWTLHLSGRTPAMLPWLARLDNAAPAGEGAGHHLLRSIAARHRGDLTGAMEAARQAIADAPPERPDVAGVAWNLLAATQVEATALDDAIDAFAHGIRLAQTGGNFLSAAVSTYYRTRLLLRQGRPTEADAACRLALAEDAADTPAAGLLQLALAEIRLIANQLEEAANLVGRGCAQAATGGSIEAFKEGNLLRARVAAAQGDWVAAEDALAEAAMRIHWLEDPRAQAELALEQAALALARGRLREAEWRLQAIDAQRKHLLPIERSLQDELTCRLWLVRGDYGPARRKLATLIDWGQSTHSAGALIGWRALAAAADYQAGAERQAAATLAETIRAGQSTGCLRPLTTPDRLLTPLLALLEQDPADYADIAETISELHAFIGNQTANPQDQPNPYEPLTRREIEIAGLIAGGLSNQAIAEKLSISLNTVKKHTSNLYAKLGVTSRTQAVARLQDAHLL